MNEIWTDPATGYRCVVLTGPVGALNGYVELPTDHPWHEVGVESSLCEHSGCYDHTPSAHLSVHGGVTFDGRMPKSGLDGWLYGFDCAHAGDAVPGLNESPGDVYRDEAYVKSECAKLAGQLAEFASRSGE